MQLSWILVVAVWGVFGSIESARIEDPNHLHDAHLVGGGPVDSKIPQPLVAQLITKQNQDVTLLCEATIVKRSGSSYAYFLTAAECFQKKTGNSVQYFLRSYKNGKMQEDLQLYGDVKIHPRYDKDTKKHNLAVFKVTNKFYDLDTEIEIKSDESVAAEGSAEVFTWKDITRDHELTNTFELNSVKTRVISSFWCKLLYPFSPLKEYHLCASGWFVKGLTKDQVGTPLIQRDPKTPKKFWILGIAAIVRPWSPYWSFPMEFLNVVPYKSWINSAAMS